MLITAAKTPRLFRWSLLGLSLIAGCVANAAPIERDLGEGLKYFRAHVLPADLPAADVKPGVIVLDLRYALAEADASTALDAWLKFRATEKTPVFVLLNADTALALRDEVTGAGDRPGLITIGRTTAETAPDIVVETGVEQERRAYDALEKNVPVESLIRENAAKPRVDEASIMHARAEQNDSSDEFFGPERPRLPEAKAEAPPPPLVDRTLQRAVQLHRALLALKRL
jgi:hypothetical protein